MPVYKTTHIEAARKLMLLRAACPQFRWVLITLARVTSIDGLCDSDTLRNMAHSYRVYEFGASADDGPAIPYVYNDMSAVRAESEVFDVCAAVAIAAAAAGAGENGARGDGVNQAHSNGAAYLAPLEPFEAGALSIGVEFSVHGPFQVHARMQAGARRLLRGLPSTPSGLVIYAAVIREGAGGAPDHIDAAVPVGLLADPTRMSKRTFRALQREIELDDIRSTLAFGHEPLDVPPLGVVQRFEGQTDEEVASDIDALAAANDDGGAAATAEDDDDDVDDGAGRQEWMRRRVFTSLDRAVMKQWQQLLVNSRDAAMEDEDGLLRNSVYALSKPCPVLFDALQPTTDPARVDTQLFVTTLLGHETWARCGTYIRESYSRLIDAWRLDGQQMVIDVGFGGVAATTSADAQLAWRRGLFGDGVPWVSVQVLSGAWLLCVVQQMATRAQLLLWARAQALFALVVRHTVFGGQTSVSFADLSRAAPWLGADPGCAEMVWLSEHGICFAGTVRDAAGNGHVRVALRHVAKAEQETVACLRRIQRHNLTVRTFDDSVAFAAHASTIIEEATAAAVHDGPCVHVVDCESNPPFARGGLAAWTNAGRKTDPLAMDEARGTWNGDDDDGLHQPIGHLIVLHAEALGVMQMAQLVAHQESLTAVTLVALVASPVSPPLLDSGSVLLAAMTLRGIPHSVASGIPSTPRRTEARLLSTRDVSELAAMLVSMGAAQQARHAPWIACCSSALAHNLSRRIIARRGDGTGDTESNAVHNLWLGDPVANGAIVSDIKLNTLQHDQLAVVLSSAATARRADFRPVLSTIAPWSLLLPNTQVYLTTEHMLPAPVRPLGLFNRIPRDCTSVVLIVTLGARADADATGGVDADAIVPVTDTWWRYVCSTGLDVTVIFYCTNNAAAPRTVEQWQLQMAREMPRKVRRMT